MNRLNIGGAIKVEARSNCEIIKSVYEAVGDVHQDGEILKGDVDYLRQILAEDIEWNHPTLGGAYYGIESVINDVLIPFWKTWDDTLDSPRYIVEGD